MGHLMLHSADDRQRRSARVYLMVGVGIVVMGWTGLCLSGGALVRRGSGARAVPSRAER